VSAIAVHSPFSGELVGSAPVSSSAEVVDALDLGAAYVSQLSRHERSQLLFAVAERLRAHTLRVPVGLVAAITPFNHPLNPVAHKLAPFGGIGDSGLGVKEGVREAIRAMTCTKLYTLPWG
jgi:acyl-CoA reductase-like NAD-dependent aldehyde dehydrogenase